MSHQISDKTIVLIYYCPQRSWGKTLPVIFSEACVKNSVHRRVCLSACWDTTIPLPPRAGTPLGPGTPQDQAAPLHRTKHLPGADPPGANPPLGPGTPPEQSMLGDMDNERAVRILLECNLVCNKTSVGSGNMDTTVGTKYQE